jgi:hypothetical protein
MSKYSVPGITRMFETQHGTLEVYPNLTNNGYVMALTFKEPNKDGGHNTIHIDYDGELSASFHIKGYSKNTQDKHSEFDKLLSYQNIDNSNFMPITGKVIRQLKISLDTARDDYSITDQEASTLAGIMYTETPPTIRQAYGDQVFGHTGDTVGGRASVDGVTYHSNFVFSGIEAKAKGNTPALGLTSLRSPHTEKDGKVVQYLDQSSYNEYMAQFQKKYLSDVVLTPAEAAQIRAELKQIVMPDSYIEDAVAKIKKDFEDSTRQPNDAKAQESGKPPHGSRPTKKNER